MSQLQPTGNQPIGNKQKADIDSALHRNEEHLKREGN